MHHTIITLVFTGKIFFCHIFICNKLKVQMQARVFDAIGTSNVKATKLSGDESQWRTEVQSAVNDKKSSGLGIMFKQSDFDAYGKALESIWQKYEKQKKAIAEAKKYGEVIVAASSKDKNYSYIPDCSDLDIPEDTDYVYICENETIHGVTWPKLPNTKGHVLVSDQSSMFLSKPCNVSDYGIIYGGVQKNIGPAGLAIVIIREDLIRDDLKDLPIYLQYSTHAGSGSMYNTPNCWAIYVCGKVFKYLKSIGGLAEMEKINVAKAKVFYDFLDQSKLFQGTVRKEDRSLMNIPFVTGDADLDAEVIAYTKKAGFENLKGHKSVGGLRASVYNAMPIEGVIALVECLKKFEEEHK